MYVLSVVCCQTEVPTTSWSLVQRSPTDWCSCVWSRNVVKGDALVHWGLLRQKQTIIFHESLFWAKWIWYTPSHSTCVRFCLILSSHMCGFSTLSFHCMCYAHTRLRCGHMDLVKHRSPNILRLLSFMSVSYESQK